MKFPITGPAYEHASQDVNNQRSVNFYVSSGGPEGRSPAALMPTPGLKEVIDLSGSNVRALMKFDSRIYAVMDSTLYEIIYDESAQTATSVTIGTIGSAEGQLLWDRNPTQIMIADSEKGYILTPSTNTLAEITDADFTGASTLTFFDSYFVYNTPNASTMFSTASNDGSTISALDVATAEGRSDKLVAVINDKRELWAFGEDTVEIWYNAANTTGFPFSRREGAFLDLGCAAALSVIQFNNSLVWLDRRGFILMADGYGAKVISSEAISKEIRSYAETSDAWAFQFTDRGNLFYVITFPTAKKTWAYNAANGTWCEMAYWTGSEFEHHLANCHLRFNQSDLVGDRKSGKIYVLDANTYKDGSDTIHRLRSTQFINQEFHQFGVNCLEVHLESGKALSTGTGSDPQIMMRYSNDGGYVWSYEMARSMGKIGEYSKRVRWNRLGTAREWLFEFRITDPIGFSIIDASLDLEGTLNG